MLNLDFNKIDRAGAQYLFDDLQQNTVSHSLFTIRYQCFLLYTDTDQTVFNRK